MHVHLTWMVKKHDQFAVCTPVSCRSAADLPAMSSNEPMYFRRARLMRMQDKLSMAMLYLIGAGTLGAVGFYLYALKTKQISACPRSYCGLG